MQGRLTMWKERIKTNFHGQYVPYDMYCNATVMLGLTPYTSKVKTNIPKYIHPSPRV